MVVGGGGGGLYARLQFTSCVTTIPAFVVSVVQFVCNLILFQLDLHVKNRKFSTETKSTPSSSSPEG